MNLYDAEGMRKYLTPAEREQFPEAAEAFPREVRTFCATLAYTVPDIGGACPDRRPGGPARTA